MSSRMRSSFPRRNPARSSRAPIACATSEGTSSGSERPASGTQKTPSRSVPDELGRDLERQAGLPGAAGPGEREEARAVREQRDELLRARARARRAGSRRSGRFVASSVRSGGKSPSPSWYRRSAPIRSLSRCSPRSRTSRIALEEAARRLGEDDLPSVRGGGDARSAVDVDADVALVRHDRLAGVEPHAYADRAALERAPRLGGGGNGVGGARKRDEEGIALGVDLDARVPRERVPQRSPMLGEQSRRIRPRAPGGVASSPRRR